MAAQRDTKGDILIPNASAEIHDMLGCVQERLRKLRKVVKMPSRNDAILTILRKIDCNELTEKDAK